MAKEDITITIGGDIVDVSKEPHASVRRMQPGEMLVALFVGGEQKGSFTYRGMDEKFAWALSDAAGKLLSELHPGEDGEIQVHEPIIARRAGGASPPEVIEPAPMSAAGVFKRRDAISLMEIEAAEAGREFVRPDDADRIDREMDRLRKQSVAHLRRPDFALAVLKAFGDECSTTRADNIISDCRNILDYFVAYVVASDRQTVNQDMLIPRA